MLKIVLLAPVVLLSACATIVSGTSQAVSVSTTPAGAACAVDRLGMRIAVVPQTPGAVRVDKSKNDLMVTCSLPGYQTTTVVQPSGFNITTLGNVFVGGLIGIGIDAASGAINQYPSNIRMDLPGGIPGYGSSPYAAQRRGYPRTNYAAERYRYSPTVLPDPVAAHAASY